MHAYVVGLWVLALGAICRTLLRNVMTLLTTFRAVRQERLNIIWSFFFVPATSLQSKIRRFHVRPCYCAAVAAYVLPVAN